MFAMYNFNLVIHNFKLIAQKSLTLKQKIRI
jgi:hypothetical protein